MNAKTPIIIMAISLVLLWSTGCRKPLGINGNSKLTTETRRMLSFDRIINEASFNVHITHDSIYEVIVEAESNLMPYIRTLINGNTLIIDTRENLNNQYPINIYVKAPALNSIELQGSGLVNLDSIVAENFQMEVGGSGNITGVLTGSTLNAEIRSSGNITLEAHLSEISTKISGSGNIDLVGESNKGYHTINGSGNINSYNFIQKGCNARITGSGNMYLNVIDYLNVDISGSGSVFYIGNPQISVKITGSGSVIHQ